MRIPKQMRTSLLALTAVFLFCIIIVCMAFAEETEFADLTEQNASAEAEIVFLLDTSESMKTQDRAMRAVDAIRQGAYSLPSNYPVGMISYGTEVWEVMPLSTDRQKLDMQLDQIQYGGYTNAGTGLSQAVALFSESNEKERYIIMLSDGEIDMPDTERARQSREDYLQAAADAKEKGINIFIIAVGNAWKTPQVHIFDAAEMTNGAIYFEGQSGSLSQIIGKITGERIRFPREALEITDRRDGEAVIQAPFPVGASRVSILVLNSDGIEQVTVKDKIKEADETKDRVTKDKAIQDNGEKGGKTKDNKTKASETKDKNAESTKEENAEITEDRKAILGAADIKNTKDIEDTKSTKDKITGKIITGKYFAVAEFDSLTFLTSEESNPIELHIYAPELSSVQAYLCTEFDITPQVKVDYRIEPVSPILQAEAKQTAPSFQHFADITITFTDTKDNQTILFAEPPFSGREITFFLNGEPYTTAINHGKIQQTIPADEIEQVEVFVDLYFQDTICHIKQPGPIQIPKTPDPKIPEPAPKPDYRPLWIVLGILAAMLLLLSFWYLKKSHTTIIYMAQPQTPNNLSQKSQPQPQLPKPRSSKNQLPKTQLLQKRFPQVVGTYTGKFNLYLIQTAEDLDIPPQTYRLFGRQGEPLTLAQILSSCEVKLGKIGEEGIVFYPGPDHSVIVTNQSEHCTVLKKMEILKKGTGYPVYYNEKITITFEDGITEMEVHYKNLKPSEKQAYG